MASERTPGACDLLTERPQAGGGFKPRTSPLWGNGANHHTTVPNLSSSSKNTFDFCFSCKSCSYFMRKIIIIFFRSKIDSSPLSFLSPSYQMSTGNCSCLIGLKIKHVQLYFTEESHHVASPKRPHSSLINVIIYFTVIQFSPKSACLINSKNLIPEEFLLLILFNTHCMPSKETCG